MTQNPAPRGRRSLRLRGYDYAKGGAYFVTICTQDRACLFGEVSAGSIRLNQSGRQIAMLWESLASRFSGVEIDLFVVMPNHQHGILVLPDVEAMATRLGDVAGAFKSMTTVDYIRGVKAKGWPKFRWKLWQRNYYEHVVRDETELNRIRQYIDDNPAQWEFDDENPLKVRPWPPTGMVRMLRLPRSGRSVAAGDRKGRPKGRPYQNIDMT
jgi:putative transposase